MLTSDLQSNLGSGPTLNSTSFPPFILKSNNQLFELDKKSMHVGVSTSPKIRGNINFSLTCIFKVIVFQGDQYPLSDGDWLSLIQASY